MTDTDDSISKGIMYTILGNEKYTGTYIFTLTDGKDMEGDWKKNDDDVILLEGGMPPSSKEDFYHKKR